jgi:hypothetical protein
VKYIKFQELDLSTTIDLRFSINNCNHVFRFFFTIRFPGMNELRRNIDYILVLKPSKKASLMNCLSVPLIALLILLPEPLDAIENNKIFF